MHLGRWTWSAGDDGQIMHDSDSATVSKTRVGTLQVDMKDSKVWRRAQKENTQNSFKARDKLETEGGGYRYTEIINSGQCILNMSPEGKGFTRDKKRNNNG